MRILITGITGFVGSHLADYYLGVNEENKNECEIHGTLRHRSNTENIDHIREKLKLHDCNVTDAISVMQTIKEIKPNVIHHLAAQSFVPTSWKAPQDTITTNVLGTVNLLEAIKEYCPECIVQIAGSSEEYGLVYPYETPIRETNLLRPLSPYGVSKVAQDLVGQQYFRSHGLRVRITRAFNHEGPRRGVAFVTSDFAKQLVEIENGERTVLMIGNLDAVRDFTDVRDVVKAYYKVTVFGGDGQVYNVCSGEGWSIREVLEQLMDFSMISEQYKISEDPAKMRPSDVPLLIGDNTKIKDNLLWRPEISFRETLREILEYWRKKCR